jgi:hypothetical protein
MYVFLGNKLLFHCWSYILRSYMAQEHLQIQEIPGKLDICGDIVVFSRNVRRYCQ